MFLPASLLAQKEPTKGKKILIKNAEKAIYQKGKDRNRLLGNVIFEHEGALLYCDSAWLYRADNRVKAFRNVRINQGDTLFLWGDYLQYNGNSRKALVTGDTVKLKDPEMILLTDRLNYDRNTGEAYYTTGGRITNDENLLVSQMGSYFSRSKMFHFKDSVVLTNPEYVIESDTLLYSSQSRRAFFHGPTTITSDSSFIYCENGVYHTREDIARFDKNAFLYDDNRVLTGDSLYYEKRNRFGEAFENVVLHDTADEYLITGGYGRYIGSRDSSFVTLDPLYSIDQEGDTLHVHGDTIFAFGRSDSLGDYRQVLIYHGVRFFKSDLQGRCDSLTYATRDSVFRLYRDPVVWSDSSQVTGDTIYLTTRNEALDSLKVFSNSFILTEKADGRYNQIKGRNTLGKFINNELRKVLVKGNGQTIYYPKDEDGSYIGMNRAVCSNIMIRLKDNEVESITFLAKPEAKLYPLKEAVGEVTKLDNMHPRFEEKPSSKQSLFAL